ncbi:MAG: tryptophan-rich sensory protein [Salibacteraceae bacterium]
MKKAYALLNALVTVLMIIWNYYTSVYGFNGNNVGSLSEEYNNLFTPAGYAFSIWGIIFLGLLFHAFYQLKKAFWSQQHNQFLTQIGPWLIIANLGNILWVYLWLMEYTGWSVVAMVVILFSLTKTMVNLNMERWDAPFKVIRWIWWPIVIYAGWIGVASIANVSAYLAKIGWSNWFSEETWTIIMIFAATALNLFMLFNRSMREYAAVGVWALSAIAVRHWGELPSIQWAAVSCIAILFIAMSWHAAKNWDTNPINKAIKNKVKA